MHIWIPDTDSIKDESNKIAFPPKADHPQMCVFSYAGVTLTLIFDFDLDVPKT